MANEYSISVEASTVRDLTAAYHAYEAFASLLAGVSNPVVNRSEVLALLSVLNERLGDVSGTFQCDLDAHDDLLSMGYVFPHSVPFRLADVGTGTSAVTNVGG